MNHARFTVAGIIAAMLALASSAQVVLDMPPPPRKASAGENEVADVESSDSTEDAAKAADDDTESAVEDTTNDDTEPDAGLVSLAGYLSRDGLEIDYGYAPTSLYDFALYHQRRTLGWHGGRAFPGIGLWHFGSPFGFFHGIPFGFHHHHHHGHHGHGHHGGGFHGKFRFGGGNFKGFIHF